MITIIVSMLLARYTIAIAIAKPLLHDSTHYYTACLTFMHLDNSGKKFVQLNKKEKESALGAIKSFTLNTIRDPLEQVGLQASSIKIKSIDSNKEVRYALVSQKTSGNVIPTCVPCNRRKIGFMFKFCFLEYVCLTHLGIWRSCIGYYVC